MSRRLGGGHVDAERARAEVGGQGGPQLRRATSVVEGPNPNSAEVVLIDQGVLLCERYGVVPIQLARAVELRVQPGVPSLLSGRIVGIPMDRGRVGSTGGVRGLADRIKQRIS